MPEKLQLTPELILATYRKGYFPMASGPNGKIEFCAFEPRGVIPLDDRFKVRRSLLQAMKRDGIVVTFDQAFPIVIRECSRHNILPDDEVWLSEELIGLYETLHQRGIVHSVEVWNVHDNERELVGGLYGVHLGSAFCGESMFSLRPFASQIALVHLVKHLRERRFTLLDAQMPSDHLKQFGLLEVSHETYLRLLEESIRNPVEF